MPHFEILGAPIGDLVFCAKFVAQKQLEASMGSIDPPGGSTSSQAMWELLQTSSLS